MTTFDVHADKAMKELRARLDHAERERDEARAEQRDAEASRDLLVAGYTRAIREWLATHPGDSVPDVVDLFRAVMAERDEAGRAFRDLVAVLDRDGGQRQAGETIAGTLERATRLAADLVVGEPERRDAAVAAEREACAYLCQRLAESSARGPRRESYNDAARLILARDPGSCRWCGAPPSVACVCDRSGARATSPTPSCGCGRSNCDAAEQSARREADLAAPAPVAAERAVLLALVERAASLGRLTLWHGDDCPHRYCDDCDADRDDDCAAREGDECECSTWEIARLACDARDALVAARKGGG